MWFLCWAVSLSLLSFLKHSLLLYWWAFLFNGVKLVDLSWLLLGKLTWKLVEELLIWEWWRCCERRSDSLWLLWLCFMNRFETGMVSSDSRVLESSVVAEWYLILVQRWWESWQLSLVLVVLLELQLVEWNHHHCCDFWSVLLSLLVPTPLVDLCLT